jgi:hypothetical protein
MATTEIELQALHAQDVLVTQLARARKRAKQPYVNFTGRLIGANVADTMRGSSTLTLEIIDEGHQLLTSGFFDARDDGKLDALEIEFPVKSGNWWRLSAVDLGADERISMSFMERIAVEMLAKTGPMKTSRAKKTRAEFLQTLVTKSDKAAVFHSKELRKKQRKQKDPKDPVTDADRKATKSGGIPNDADLKINTHPASHWQLRQAEAALDVATELNAPEKAVQAMVVAGIGESEFKTVVNSGGYGGVFQAQVETGGRYFKKTDTGPMAESFLKGGKGFGGGGAIDQAKKFPDKSPGMIAADVEVSYPNAYLPNAAAAEHHYQQHIGEAKKIIEAYGGGGFSSASYHGQYNFTVGRKEKLWDAAQRLAADVNWAFFIDGNTVYYDSEQTLIGQKPAATIHRNSPYVVDWNATWDERHVATECSLTLICSPFEFGAGEVMRLVGFGPLSTGSTGKPKRPGHWLIAESARDIGNLATQFTLRQPTNPKLEPRSELVQRRDGEQTSTDLTAAMDKISRNQSGYGADTHNGMKFRDMRASMRFDCSSSCSYALWLAGMMPGDTAQVSGWFASNWGKAGRGQDFTVWANGGHVFMLSEGKPHWRFDTGGPGGGSGAHYYTGAAHGTRDTAGFTPRHWSGS